MSKQKISKYAKPDFFEYVTLATISTEIGRTRRQTEKLLDKLGYIGLGILISHVRIGSKSPRPKLYDARAIEAIKALLKQPHRKTGTSADDWLSDFINDGGTNE